MPWHQKHLLSCNWALTGNLTNDGSCTLRYVAKKKNITDITINIDNIFKQYYFTLQANKYKSKIKKASQKFITSNKHGILLQLIFKDPKLAQKTIYMSASRGYHRNHFVNNSNCTKSLINNLRNIIKTHKQKLIYDFTAIDSQQIRVILTHDKLLDVANPEIYNNFEVHAYSTNQQALDEFHHEIDAIMAQIKADYLTTKGGNL